MKAPAGNECLSFTSSVLPFLLDEFYLYLASGSPTSLKQARAQKSLNSIQFYLNNTFSKRHRGSMDGFLGSVRVREKFIFIFTIQRATEYRHKAAFQSS